MRVYFDLDRALQEQSKIDAEVAEYNAEVSASNHRTKTRLTVVVALFEITILVFTWFCFFRHALDPEAWNSLHGPYAASIGVSWIFFGVSVASFAFWITKEKLDSKYRDATQEYSPAARYLYEYQRNTIMETTGTCGEDGKWTLIITLENPTTHTISTFSQDGFSKEERTNLTAPIFDLDSRFVYFPPSSAD